MDYAFLEPWHAFLPQEAGHVLGLVGDGDLEAMVAQIAAFYARLEMGVIVYPPGRTGSSVSGVDDLREQNPASVVVCLPEDLPAPDAGGKIAWPQTTSLALIIMAGQRVGLPANPGLREDTHCDSRKPENPYRWEDLEARLVGPDGYLDRIPPDLPVVATISGLEDVDDSIGLFALADRIMQHPRLPLVSFLTRRGDGLVVRTAYREENGGNQ